MGSLIRLQSSQRVYQSIEIGHKVVPHGVTICIQGHAMNWQLYQCGLCMGSGHSLFDLPFSDPWLTHRKQNKPRGGRMGNRRWWGKQESCGVSAGACWQCWAIGVSFGFPDHPCLPSATHSCPACHLLPMASSCLPLTARVNNPELGPWSQLIGLDRDCPMRLLRQDDQFSWPAPMETCGELVSH